MAVATDPRGLKRICPSCGTRYYDFNKRPAACPECKTEFTTEQTKVKGRRGRATIANDDTVAQVKKGAAVADDEDEALLTEDADLVSLDEVEDLEKDDDADDLADDDVDVDLDLVENLDDIDDLDEELDEEELVVDEDEDK